MVTVKGFPESAVKNQGTIQTPEVKIPEDTRTPAQKCKDEGGIWDAVTQTCSFLPKSETKKTEEPKTQDQVFRDQDTGNISGLTIGGKTFLGLNPKDVEKVTSAKQAKQQGGPATQSFEQGAQAQAQALRSQEALNNLGLSPEQIAGVQGLASEAGIDWGQAATAGASQAVPGVIAGALGGAAIGAVGGPVGAVGGALLGGVGAFLNGVRSNIKSQQKGEIASTQKVLTNAKSNLRQIRMLAQADPSRADEAIELYNQQMALVYQAQRKLKLETQGNLNKFMDDGTEKLVEFDLFLMQGGYADLQRQRLEQALIGGVPLSPEQIMMELQTEMESEQ